MYGCMLLLILSHVYLQVACTEKWTWAEWENEPDKCQRACDETQAYYAQKRVCQYCYYEGCKPTTRPYNCEGDETRQKGEECRHENMDCYGNTDSPSGESRSGSSSSPAASGSKASSLHGNTNKGTPRKDLPANSPNYGTWTTWSQWTCDRRCNHDLKAKRTRECKDSAFDFGCKPDSHGRSDIDQVPCKRNGKPICHKTWSEWTEWMSCSQTCGDYFTTVRMKVCKGEGAECAGKDMEHKRCPSAASCPYLDGGWGEWADWDWGRCSAACGRGVYKKFRKCNNPLPLGRGRDCIGEAERTTACEAITKCIINGMWSNWSPWRCQEPCGPSKKTRKRICQNPIPQDGGAPCVGLAVEHAQGCSNISCPIWKDKAYNEDLFKKMATLNLRLQDNSYVRDEGGAVEFVCDNAVTRFLRKGALGASLQWKLNGFTMAPDSARMFFVKTGLRITGLERTDSGVYVCQMSNHNVGIFTLAVTPNEAIEITAGTDLELDCKDAALGKLSPHLTQVWYRGDILMENGVVPLTRATTMLTNASSWLDGKWECLVGDVVNGREWLTNIVIISIVPTSDQQSDITFEEIFTNIGDMGQCRDVKTLKCRIAVAIIALLVISLIGTIVGVVLHRRRENKELAAEEAKEKCTERK